MEIHLVRHTTVAIEKGICYGQADIPVSATFESEANALAAFLFLANTTLTTTKEQLSATSNIPQSKNFQLPPAHTSHSQKTT